MLSVHELQERQGREVQVSKRVYETKQYSKGCKNPHRDVNTAEKVQQYPQATTSMEGLQGHVPISSTCVEDLGSYK